MQESKVASPKELNKCPIRAMLPAPGPAHGAQHPSSPGDQNSLGMGLVTAIILYLLYALCRGCEVQGRGHWHPKFLLLTPHQGVTPVSAGEISAAGTLLWMRSVDDRLACFP